jgi:phosphoribosylformimino-5-aminoimidazole carboxamide ribotide isomerase
VNIPIQVGGAESALYQDAKEPYLMRGVERVILGTAAIKNPSLARMNCCTLYKEKESSFPWIVLDGYVQVEGWTLIEVRPMPFEFARTLKKLMGVKTIVYTDISKDGMLQGPNFEQLSKIQDERNGCHRFRRCIVD